MCGGLRKTHRAAPGHSEPIRLATFNIDGHVSIIVGRSIVSTGAQAPAR
jgi:hypothetical protein